MYTWHGPSLWHFTNPTYVSVFKQFLMSMWAGWAKLLGMTGIAAYRAYENVCTLWQVYSEIWHVLSQDKMVSSFQGNAGNSLSRHRHTTKCLVCIDRLLPSHIALLLLPLTLHNPLPTWWCNRLKQTKTSNPCILECLVRTRLVWQDMPYFLQSAIIVYFLAPAQPQQAAAKNISTYTAICTYVCIAV